MITPTNDLIINGSVAGKYDKNQQYGMSDERGKVSFFKILKMFYLGNYKITISKYTEMQAGKDFVGIAFETPPKG